MTTTKTMTLALALIMMLTMVSFISRRPPAPSPSHAQQFFRRVFAARRVQVSHNSQNLDLRQHTHHTHPSSYASIIIGLRARQTPRYGIQDVTSLFPSSVCLSLCLSLSVSLPLHARRLADASVHRYDVPSGSPDMHRHRRGHQRRACSIR